jgi:hypothetical protein
MDDLFQRYADAWGSREPDAIVALHTGDTTFHAHVGLIDLIAVENGLVKSKDSYLDAVSMQAQLGMAVAQ